MVDGTGNLLSTLNRWSSGQPKKFLTDAFVHLLNRLADSSPESFVSILERLTRGEVIPDPETVGAFRIRSQIATDQGTPDIEISGENTYILVEVKDRSPVDPDQLRRYSEVIDEQSVSAPSVWYC